MAPKDKIRLAKMILGKPKPIDVSEWEIKRLQIIHPWASRDTIIRIAQDQKRRRTTSKEGKTAYQRLLMRERRRQQK